MARPKTSAAVLAARSSICLLECLEDDSLLLERNTNSCVGNLEGNRRKQPGRESDGPPSILLSAIDTERRTPPWSVNLNALDKQVLEHLLQALRVGHKSTRQMRVPYLPRNPAGGSPPRAGRAVQSSPAGRRTRLSSASTETVPDSIFERSRISVMRLSRSVPAPWMVRANSTCFAVRLPPGLSLSC